MNVVREHRELFSGFELNLIRAGINFNTGAGVICFKMDDLDRFINLKFDIGVSEFENVKKILKVKSKITGIYGSEDGYSLSYLKCDSRIYIISHIEIQPARFIVFLEGIITNYHQ